MKRSFPTLLLILALCTCGRAQSLIGNLVDFDGNPAIGWTSTGVISTSSDGTASGTPFWGSSRSPIQSGSRQNALLLQGDFARFASPFLSFPADQEVWLGFHQYYRQNESGSATIELREDGLLRRTIDLSANLKPGAETGPYDTVMINLTNELAGIENMTVEFVFTGRSYFWLLDDIGFYDGPPQTKPSAFGNYLRQEDYDFAVDSANWAYVPNQLVVQFNGTATSQYQDSLRQAFGARLVDSCACDFVELWEIDGSLIQSQGGEQEDATGMTGILSNIIAAKSKTKVDGVDLNYLTNTQPVPAPPATSNDLTASDLNGLSISTANPIRIAIMDTGLDYKDPVISPYVRIRQNNQTGAPTDGDNCLPNDPIGWNYVDNNNNPFDDNSHGTHVAGIIADSLNKYGGDTCVYEFIAYKTHDHNGVSTLFDVACATFQATLDDVDIINDSWGFFGDPSVILANAIDTVATRDILVISAAGNDMIDLDTLLQYPACYPAPNVITVGATAKADGPNGEIIIIRAPFSNFSPTYVDILAPGTDIASAVPSWGNPADSLKSGTSMATPMVTAAAAMLACCFRSQSGVDTFSYQEVKADLLANALVSDLNNFASNGWLLVYPEDCRSYLVPTRNQFNTGPGFEVFPNPTRGELSIRARGRATTATIRLLSPEGRVLFSTTNPSWLEGEVQSITLPKLPAGMYLLQISGQDYLWTEKLLRF